MNCYTESMDWTLVIGKFSIGILDIIIVVMFLSTSIGCTAVGFSRSAAKIIGWILCYPCAFYLTSLVAQVFNSYSNIGLFFSTMLAFAVSSVIVFAIFNLLGSLLGNVLSGIGLGAVDSILGFVWGVFMTILAAGILIFILSKQTIFDLQPLFDKSYAYQWIQPLLPSTQKVLAGVLDGIL